MLKIVGDGSFMIMGVNVKTQFVLRSVTVSAYAPPAKPVISSVVAV